MNITFYTPQDKYKNRVSDRECLGIVRDMTFDQLVYNLKFPKIVDITLDGLNALANSKDDKDQFQYLTLKDNGFFIAGLVKVNSMSRKREYVVNRTVITLDIDEPVDDVWTTFKSKFKGIQSIKYSTIRHTTDKPRYRILIPLSEPVNEEVFEKISKYVALIIGEESIDKTTHEFARVMFLPAITSDGNYNFDYQKGEPLSVIEVLPMAEALVEGTTSETTANPDHKDPRDKAGFIGAFNRAYSVTQAIDEFIPEIYLKGNNFDEANPRYKYFKSDSMPGARVYNDDTLLYSAHDTDPAVHKQLDAFNLIKLHKFSDNFEDMLDFVKGLSSVKTEVFNITKNENSMGEDWTAHLAVDKHNRILDNLYNLQLIFQNDEHLSGIVKLNQLTFMVEVAKDLIDIGGARNRVGKTLEDADVTDIRVYLEICQTPIRSTKQNVIDTMLSIARLNAYHPVREYLESLEDAWDGVARIETMFTEYLNANDTNINRVIARKIMAAAVWRVFRPGIKWEGIVTFHGIQGSGKSTFVQKLYKSSPYDTDYKNWVNSTAIDMSNTDKAIERTKMFWAVELAELANMTLNNFSNEQMKAFISTDRPTTRIPYDKFPITFDRQLTFWATTNVWLYVSDQTGGRRFLPVDTGIRSQEEKFEALRKINAMPTDQLWAEAMTYYKDEPLFFTVEQEYELEKLRQMHTEESGYQAVLSNFVTAKVPEDWHTKTPLERREYFQRGGNEKFDIYDKTYITLSEIAYEAIGKPISDINRKAVREIELVMFNLGWTIASHPIKTVYGQSKTFVNINKGGNHNENTT